MNCLSCLIIYWKSNIGEFSYDQWSLWVKKISRKPTWLQRAVAGSIVYLVAPFSWCQSCPTFTSSWARLLGTFSSATPSGPGLWALQSCCSSCTAARRPLLRSRTGRSGRSWRIIRLIEFNFKGKQSLLRQLCLLRLIHPRHSGLRILQWTFAFLLRDRKIPNIWVGSVRVLMCL